MTARDAVAPWGPPPYPQPPTDRAARAEAVARTPLAWTSGVALRAGRVTIGGSPWTVTLIPERFRVFARRLFAANRRGVLPATPEETDAALFLLDLGIADPLPPTAAAASRPDDVEVVVPVYRHVEELERCLASLREEGLPVIVVDDASPRPDAARIRKAARAHGARLIVRKTNGGPGEARNDGFRASTAPFVAFLDADVTASPGFAARLRPLFDDPLVGALGPRVRPRIEGGSAIELYEETRSELDMGPDPSRVVYGVPVGWLPSASVIVRRSAVTDPPFEPGMRVGEDVDLFWRMHEAGWTVRYVPDVVHHHEVRTALTDFSQRRAMYGSSAAELELRHPGRLIPARPSLSGLAMVAVLANRRSWVRLLALPIAGYEFARQRRLLGPRMPLSIAVEMTGRSLWSDAFWMGHLLRRDWWPVGWGVLVLTPFSRLARGVAAAMIWEPVRDHLLRPTRLGPFKSLALRLVDDASYGSGVIRNAIRKRVPNVVTPRVRIPSWPARSAPAGGATMQAGPQAADAPPVRRLQPVDAPEPAEKATPAA
ncbi:mycofactocin biosynthesis glycosyltransferase MftF [Leucobacter allii]|uniref:Mycofactocin biosynthesis glycosyltransferase MftF n=1 Tax=Leucobacter allii TaxID=2932247 RepID=A0ABY4FMP5_9MICO|nr:mycofactocin biosynthesis glycosyltransferase MftF [Leucobacter allii]UOQ57544.1 mycofactocin biosynthesis glycosyltransferase MftF [Leucobacter allii]